MRLTLMGLLILSASCEHKRADEVEPAKFAKVLYRGAADGAQLTATALPELRSPATGGPWGWLYVPLFFICLPRWNVQVQLAAQTPGHNEPITVVNLYDSENKLEFGSVISELSVVSCHDPCAGQAPVPRRTHRSQPRLAVEDVAPRLHAGWRCFRVGHRSRRAVCEAARGDADPARRARRLSPCTAESCV